MKLLLVTGLSSVHHIKLGSLMVCETCENGYAVGFNRTQSTAARLSYDTQK